MTMTLIETKTLASSAALIEFTSIPQDGTDLLLTLSARTDRASVTDDGKIEFNGVNTNQSIRVLFGNGATISSATDTIIYGWVNGGSSTSNTFSNTHYYLANYSGSTVKLVSIDAVNEGNQTTQYQAITAGLWNSTTAITSISIKPYVGPNFVTGTTASLYKITKGTLAGVVVS